MIKRRLGKTNLEVSVIGFGGIPIQRVSDEEAKVILDKALELGSNFIDTARGYTISEERIGLAIEGKREKWIIATKSMERGYDAMKKDIQISLENLKTDYIELYQVHFIKDMEQYNTIMGENGAYRALEEAKESGKIGFIGITSHSADVLEAVIGSGKFDTIQFPYNLVERQGENLFEIAKSLDIGVIIMKPIGGGAFNNGELSLKFILQNNNVTTIIPGMEKLEEVEKNMKSGSEISKLTKDELDEIEELRRTLGVTFCRRCGYCMPCEVGINIPGAFILEAYLTRYDLEEWARTRYALVEDKPDKCTECGVCETRCPYDLPIREMLKKSVKAFND